MRFLRTPIDVRQAAGYGYLIVSLTWGHCTRELRWHLPCAR